MAELGYDMALSVLPRSGKTEITVQLVMFRSDLVELHKSGFAKKI